ncbi:MAG: hypothetical protein WBY69_22355, partial [Candidatus Acidiferrales bacterium]
QQPSTWHGSSEQILLNQVGCEARKRPAVGDVSFLDFYLYRTNRELRGASRRITGKLVVLFTTEMNAAALAGVALRDT